MRRRQRDFELTPHVLANWIAQEIFKNGVGVWGYVKRLVGVNARFGRGRYVPNSVAAGFAEGNVGGFQVGPQLRRFGQFHEVQLNILARGGMEIARGVLVRTIGNGDKLVGGDAAIRQLNSNHLHARLPLPIHAARKPKFPKGFVRNCSRRKNVYFLL